MGVNTHLDRALGILGHLRVPVAWKICEVADLFAFAILRLGSRAHVVDEPYEKRWLDCMNRPNPC